MKNFDKLLDNIDELNRYRRGWSRGGKRPPDSLDKMRRATLQNQQVPESQSSTSSERLPETNQVINVEEILTERLRILPSIGSQISGPRAFLGRWTHRSFTKRHLAVNGFYYYLPRIFKAMHRQLLNIRKIRDLTPIEKDVLQQLNKLFSYRMVAPIEPPLLNFITPPITHPPLLPPSYPVPGRRSPLAMALQPLKANPLLSFPGYGGGPDAIDLNDEE